MPSFRGFGQRNLTGGRLQQAPGPGWAAFSNSLASASFQRRRLKPWNPSLNRKLSAVATASIWERMVFLKSYSTSSWFSP